MPESWPSAIHVDAVDNVPLLWIDAPPPFHTFLLFRVGRADEELPNSGITHLVEHLAFPHDHSPDANSNGATGITTTGFYAWGDPLEATQFLSRISTALSRLPVERIDAQRAIILTEQEGAGGGPIAELLAERYGARAHGIVGFRQLGLHRVRGPDVTNWAARYFTSDNAIVCATGPPPGRMAFELPRGQRMPAPVGIPIDGPMPRWTAQAVGQVALGVVAGHDAAYGAAQRILERRLFRRLRQELAISYSVQSVSQIVDPLTLHRAVVADGQVESAVLVAKHMLEMAEELADRGPTGLEVREDFETLHRQLRDDPRAIGGWMMHAAECYLSGIDVEELNVYLESRRSLTASRVRLAWEQAFATAILVVPPFIEIEPARLAHRFWPPPHGPSLRGRTFHPRGMARLRGGTKAVLANDGVSLIAAGAAPLTVRFERCAALLRMGSSARTLIETDGTAVTLPADSYSAGDRLLTAVDDAIPKEKWIDIPPRNWPSTVPASG